MLAVTLARPWLSAASTWMATVLNGPTVVGLTSVEVGLTVSASTTPAGASVRVCRRRVSGGGCLGVGINDVGRCLGGRCLRGRRLRNRRRLAGHDRLGRWNRSHPCRGDSLRRRDGRGHGGHCGGPEYAPSTRVGRGRFGGHVRALVHRIRRRRWAGRTRLDLRDAGRLSSRRRGVLAGSSDGRDGDQPDEQSWDDFLVHGSLSGFSPGARASSGCISVEHQRAEWCSGLAPNRDQSPYPGSRWTSACRRSRTRTSDGARRRARPLSGAPFPSSTAATSPGS